MNSRLVIAGAAAAVVVAGAVIWTTRPPAPNETSEPATARQSIETPPAEDAASDESVTEPPADTPPTDTAEAPIADGADAPEGRTTGGDAATEIATAGEPGAEPDVGEQSAEPGEAAEPRNLTGQDGPAVEADPVPPSPSTQGAADTGAEPQPETAGEEEEAGAERPATASVPDDVAASSDAADEFAGDTAADAGTAPPEDRDGQGERASDAPEGSADGTDQATATETDEPPLTAEERDAPRQRAEPASETAEPPQAAEVEPAEESAGDSGEEQTTPSQATETADQPGVPSADTDATAVAGAAADAEDRTPAGDGQPVETDAEVAVEETESLETDSAAETDQLASSREAEVDRADDAGTQARDEEIIDTAEPSTDAAPQSETARVAADAADLSTEDAVTDEMAEAETPPLPRSEPAVEQADQAADRLPTQQEADTDTLVRDQPASETAGADDEGLPGPAPARQDVRPEVIEETVVADAEPEAERPRDDERDTAALEEETELAALPSIRPPSFDAVRVGESRMAVIAGRAPSGATVLIRSGDRVLGRVQADDRGDWLWLSDSPLEPGSYQLELAAQLPDREEPILSDRVIVMVVPEPRRTIAGADAEGNSGESLILMAPRDEVGATTALQVPEAPGSDEADNAVTESETADAGDLAVSEEESRPEAAAEETATEVATSDPQTAESNAAAGPATASITVVDYGEEGRLIVSGEGVPGASVRLYLSGEAIGEGRILTDGSWTVRADDPVDPGLYRLRADVLADDGQVLARAETPFRRDAPSEPAPPGRTEVVVQPGNSLWRIARSVYGQGMQYTVIYQANIEQIRNPDLIYPGQVFTLPTPPNALPEGLPEGGPG